MKVLVSDNKVHNGRRAALDGAELTHAADLDWHRVTVFHLDEYAGLPITHPASFRLYLWKRFMSALPLPLKERYFIDAEGDLEAECKRLNAIIKSHPIDVAFIGIGEN